ncbi:competence type IV pilus ATPase ComGA [Listeria aquatica]|uniref:competence type IV pilus ATPase ComGA n=1 Tax=Listeria aquatica TaxID=1494960 RepID=UPI003EF6668F
MPKQILANLLQQALYLNSSDIHIHPAQTGSLIRLRISGELYPFKVLNNSETEKLILFLKFQSGLDIGEKRLPQSGSFESQVGDEKIALRVSTLPHVNANEGLVIRLFRFNHFIPFLKSSIFSNESSQILKCCHNKKGLFLFSGSTGSGKSSSMYGLAELFLAEKLQSIVTIEDPVEHLNGNFLQIAVNEKAGLTYSELIRAVLRHDPDILIVGEIRDQETAAIVLRAALTGHLVLSTVHADSLAGILTRLQEFGLPESYLTQALLGISHQVLKPLYCPLCYGTCSLFCTHLKEKRTVLYEQATRKETIHSLFLDKNCVDGHSIEKQIQKGKYYGFF